MSLCSLLFEGIKKLFYNYLYIKFGKSDIMYNVKLLTVILHNTLHKICPNVTKLLAIRIIASF